MAFVVVEEKGNQVLRSELKGPIMTIGRDESNDIRLENRALSRKHAQLEVRGAGIWIRDLGSQNGTFMNGERLEGARPIQSGDVISLGGKFQLRLEGVEEAKTTTPVLTLTGPEGTHRFAMVGDEIILGRSPDCDISIGRKSISRRHLKVSLKDGKFFCEDMGSQNGTRVNGDKIRGITEVGVDDEIRVSEYLIRVSYLDQALEEGPPSGVHPPNRTMLLDRSRLAAAADMGGDFQVQVTHENRLTFSVEGGAAAGGLEAEEGGADTVGVIRPPMQPGAAAAAAKKKEEPAPAPPPPPPAPKAAKAPKGGSAPSAAAAKPAPAAKTPEASLEVSHADGPSRSVRLKGEVLCLAEDGSDDGPPDGVSYAPVGYLMFAPTPGGWLVTSVGDRRFCQVGDKPVAVHVLKDGDNVTLGGLSVTFRAE
ncbi:MAG: FHA domain-containing protein [Deltaproteobacteria bacterium]|nr:FHA domain-containing protein [Deltaproteobacteria bacterium]